MAQKLADIDIQGRLAKVSGWALQNGEITRTVQLKDFPAALLLVCAVGHAAEAVQHHPDIVIKYNKVTFSLVTHDAGGLTENDFTMAEKINSLL